jgi:hypothetical protein
MPVTFLMARRRGLWMQAAVARPAGRGEHGGLPLELRDAAVDVRRTGHHARVVHEIAGREVVGAVDHDIHALGEAPRVAGSEGFVDERDLDVRVEASDPLPRDLELRPPDVVAAVQDLSLQVRRVDVIEVDEGQLTDAGGGEVHGGRRSQAAGADEEHARGLEPPLAVLAEAGERQMPAVPFDLGRTEGRQIGHGAILLKSEVRSEK